MLIETGDENVVLTPVAQTLDSATHRVNHYPPDKYYGNQLTGSICWIEIYPMDNAIQRLNNQGQIRNPEGKLIHYMYGRVENRKW